MCSSYPWTIEDFIGELTEKVKATKLNETNKLESIYMDILPNWEDFATCDYIEIKCIVTRRSQNYFRN